MAKIKGYGNVYYTVIERRVFQNDGEAGRVFEETTDALYELGDSLDEMMPGVFINLGESGKFASAVRHLRSKSYTGDLEPIGIIHFV